MGNKNPEQLSPEIMRQFTGSEHWYRHAINRKIVFTDGAKHVADHGGAYWLRDEIALNQRYNSRVAAEEFQVWTLKADLVRKTGILTCEDDRRCQDDPAFSPRLHLGKAGLHGQEGASQVGAHYCVEDQPRNGDRSRSLKQRVRPSDSLGRDLRVGASVDGRPERGGAGGGLARRRGGKVFREVASGAKTDRAQIRKAITAADW